mgnify:FL=1
MRKSKTSKGLFSILEKIIRSHPAIYLVIRNLIKYTNIFEKDFDGLKYLNFEKTKLNIIDVGASDGIASKFFNKNLNTGTIYCYEPSKYYQEILKKNKIKNIIIKPYAIGNKDIKKKVFFPRYKFLNKKYDIISYTHYDLNLMNHFFRDFKFRKNLSIVSDTLAIKKVREFKKKIHLIKIDTNGYELAIIKGLINTIKKDLPVILTEVNKDENSINRILKNFSYEGYFYSVAKKKFTKKAETDSLNKYFLQKKHLNNKFC